MSSDTGEAMRLLMAEGFAQCKQDPSNLNHLYGLVGNLCEIISYLLDTTSNDS